MRFVFLFALACIGWVLPCAAIAPRQTLLIPPATEIGFRIYGLGLLPLDGTFSRFRGTLTYDPDAHANCRVELVVDVDSLTMSDGLVRDTVIGPDFIDATRFPVLSFSGTCNADGIGGTLALHGIARPFELMLDWGQDRVVAEGRLQRANWGMTARPILGGRTVRIRVTVPLAENR